MQIDRVGPVTPQLAFGPTTRDGSTAKPLVPSKVPYVRSLLSWVFPKGAVPVPAAAADPGD